MTNYEHYENEIKKYTKLGISFGIDKATEELVPCKRLTCKDCIFLPKSACHPNNFTCDDVKLTWADKEYAEPGVDWCKITVDTKVWVKDEGDSKWYPRYFAKYEDGKVFTWKDGATSYSIQDKVFCCTYWKYAKLAEE